MYPVTLAISQNRPAQGAARGCQNIMGFFDGADQGENAKTWCTVIAARMYKVNAASLWTRTVLSVMVEKKAPYPSGKGEVCKTFMHQFDSDRRLIAKSLCHKEL